MYFQHKNNYRDRYKLLITHSLKIKLNMMKMRSTILSVLAIATLASCSSDDNNLDIPVSGEKTFAGFTIQVKDANTRAAGGDDHADAVEQKVNGAKLFIFNGGVLETIGDVTIDPLTNEGTTALATTTGNKLVYAVVNANTDMKMPVGSTLDAFKAKAVAATSDVIAKSDNFVMIGKQAHLLGQKTAAEAIEVANLVQIDASRAAAKVVMQYDDAKVKINPVVKGLFADANFRLDQSNTNMFLPREAYELSPMGLTADQKDLLPALPTPAGEGTYDHLQAVVVDGNTGFKAAAAAWDFTYAKSFYTAENINELPTTGNTTFTLVRLKYTPDASVIKGVDKGLVGGTFYAVKTTLGAWEIYANQAEADAAQLAAPYTNGAGVNVVTAKVYTAGQCFYRLNLRDVTKTVLNEKYAVLRNHIYKINITEVNGIGGNSPIDPDVILPVKPETPLETETHISAEITVLNWIPVEMNEPLG